MNIEKAVQHLPHSTLFFIRLILSKTVNFLKILVPKLVELLSMCSHRLKSSYSNQLVSFEGFSVFRCNRFRATHGRVALYINKCYKATLVEKFRAGAYFPFVLVLLRFAGVFVLVGSVYNPGRLNFGEVEGFFPVCLFFLQSTIT
jgi:hypothetical protein